MRQQIMPTQTSSNFANICRPTFLPKIGKIGRHPTTLNYDKYKKGDVFSETRCD